MATERRTDRKLKTFRRIQAEAIRLFVEKGYDRTTVEEVAAAAGVSHMTVFRHFPTKEALVVTDEFDEGILEAIRDRPPEESPREALINTFLESLSQLTTSDRDRSLERLKLIITVPALNGALWRHWMAHHDLATEALAIREGPDADIFRLRVLVSAILGAGLSAALAWAASDGTQDLRELFDDALDALRDAFC